MPQYIIRRPLVLLGSCVQWDPRPPQSSPIRTLLKISSPTLELRTEEQQDAPTSAVRNTDIQAAAAAPWTQVLLLVQFTVNPPPGAPLQQTTQGETTSTLTHKISPLRRGRRTRNPPGSIQICTSTDVTK